MMAFGQSEQFRSKELDAAKILDPDLRRSYLACRQLHAFHGKTYFLATRLLPARKRPFVNALYGLARYADEIVDNMDSRLMPAERAAELYAWSSQFMEDLKSGTSSDPIAKAAIDTIWRFEIPHEHFAAFFKSMEMDLTITRYETYADLYQYVYGSAAVIGLQMTSILGAKDPQAFDHAQELGIAFQLVNFIRDIGEDQRRGRIYLPLNELAKFQVTEADLNRRVVNENLKAAIDFQINRVHELANSSKIGISLLEPTSRPCIWAAQVLYCQIADAVKKIDYQVFTKRAKVSTGKKYLIAATAAIWATYAKSIARS